MSEPKLISPMLDDFIIGSPISSHHGVCCCPAIENETENKFIVKVISVPATPLKMDALLLSGAYPDEASALAYFKELAEDVVHEVAIQNKLSELEGFLPYTDSQIVPKESEKGYDVYLLSDYRRTLEKHFQHHVFTHLDALNLGLDLCAALSACRRSGYLYVDLKPSNVFVSEQRMYRIGDLGFVRLDSLKYASLPEKYLSAYTPPEINDAFSVLNPTIDVYAAGLILYQAYNNGALPARENVASGEKIAAPAYADYEMSEIILKACAPTPEERWQDPMHMGQAIISYMQRNGANDTPIVPLPVDDPSQEESVDATLQQSEIIEQTDAREETLTGATASAFTEDEFGNLSFLDDLFGEDSKQMEPTDYDSEDVSKIINQADELASLDVPKPVVVPEYVDVPMPEPPKPEVEPAPEPVEADETPVLPPEEPESDLTTDDNCSKTGPEETSEDVFSFLTPTKNKNRSWLRNTIIILVLFALLAGGYYYYKNYYLLPINSLFVEGGADSLTVYIKTDIDESLLRIFCADSYGNQMHASVIDGKAEFSGLIPNTAYNIKIVTDGFHRLTGSTTTAFSTSIQTNIVQFDAVTGITDGSVILSFTVEGPDSNEWTVLYSAEGEEERSATFTSHMVTLTDLSIGKDYTFRLIPGKALYITGQDELVFTASKLVRAENLEIVSCMNNTLTAQWTAPEGERVASWSVHCTNDTYSQTIITTDTFATFKDLDHNAGYSVEVKAIGMSVSQLVTLPANSVTATNFKANTSDPTKITLTWESSKSIPADGWVLRYSIVGIDSDVTIPCDKNEALITPIIPDATYSIQLEDTNGNILLGSRMVIETGNPLAFYWKFTDFDVGCEDLVFSMCKTPNVSNWDRFDLNDNDYKTDFTIGESASFLVRIRKLYNPTTENVATMYVIRDQNGIPILTAQQNRTWRDMWYQSYCELNIPVMPNAAGKYSIEIYFNGGLANVQQFTIV